MLSRYEFYIINDVEQNSGNAMINREFWHGFF